MDTRTVAPGGHRRKRSWRKVKTNLGQYRSLERRYWAGAFTALEEERFERLVYDLRSLYKDV